MLFNTVVIEQNIAPLLSGLWTTIWICTASLAIGSLLGILVCLSKLSESVPARASANAFVNLFRTIPETVIVFWVYYCLPLLLDQRLSSTTCGIIALSIFAAAYLAEIFRAGVQAVARGQIEAAQALGMSTYYIWRHVIVPPAVRNMMPAIISLIADLVKASSLLSAIGVAELYYEANVLAAETYRYMELLSAAAVLYFLTIFSLSMTARRAEKRRAALIG
jgi:His/Glu/Gln/Arg/opine family amino acid ABC transporter permease subunit